MTRQVPDQPPNARLLVERMPGDVAFSFLLEPEGWDFELAEGDRYIIEFYGAGAMDIVVSHTEGWLTVGRPADTDVWAVTPDGTHLRIGAWPQAAFPGFDSNSVAEGKILFAPW